MASTSKSHDEEWRELIFNALNQCLEDGVPFTDITVKRICEEAHISKPTFYRYFDNKEAMALWVSKKVADAGFNQIGRTCTWFVGLYRTCLMYLRYKAYFSNAAFSHSFSASLEALMQYKREALFETVTKYRKREMDTVTAFQIESFLVASASMLRHWGESGLKMPPEEIAAYVTSVVPYGLYNLLRDPVLGLSDTQHRINRIAIENICGRSLPEDMAEFSSIDGRLSMGAVMERQEEA